MDDNLKDFLTQAVDATYKGLELKHYDFDTNTEKYDIHWYHTDTDRDISIALRDSGKRRDFDVIPLQAHNAPLGLIEIYTTFLQVFWFSHDNKVTFEEALIQLASSVAEDLDKEFENHIQ
jgi:hypothetical protein